MGKKNSSEPVIDEGYHAQSGVGRSDGFDYTKGIAW